MSSPLSRAQRRSIDERLDRIEDRLLDAPEGLHTSGSPAPETLLGTLPESARPLWARWNGLSLGNGEVEIWSVEAIGAQKHQRQAGAVTLPTDLIVGKRGRDYLVLPEDPWAEGGDVVLVADDGQRVAIGSTVEKYIHATLAQFSVLFDEDGEYRGELLDARGRLTRDASRKLLRRYLDIDQDAVMARYELAQALALDGEHRAAIQELKRAIHVFPEFCWLHFEMAKSKLALGKTDEGRASFEAAATAAPREDLAALFLATAARSSEESKRAEYAARVKALDSNFVAEKEQDVRDFLEDELPLLADDALSLGLAVEPRHLGLLSLQAQVKEQVDLWEEAPEIEDDFEEDEECYDEDGWSESNERQLTEEDDDLDADEP